MGQVKPATQVQTPGTVAPAPVMRPPFTITSIRERPLWLKALFYGQYGVGKTTLAATAANLPSMNDVIMINAEAGDLSVKTADFPDIDQVQVFDYKTACKVQEYLKVHCRLRDEDNLDELRKLEARLKGVTEDEIAEPKKYRTVIIDTISEVEASSMYQLLGVRPDSRLDEEMATAEWGEFRRNFQQIMRLVRAFRDLPMHVLMTAPSAYTQDEQKRMLYAPALTGRLAKQIQGFMDVVGFMIPAKEGDKEVRRLMVQPSARWDAKCRFAKYRSPHFDDPSMQKILQAVGLLEGLNKQT